MFRATETLTPYRSFSAHERPQPQLSKSISLLVNCCMDTALNSRSLGPRLGVKALAWHRPSHMRFNWAISQVTHKPQPTGLNKVQQDQVSGKLPVCGLSRAGPGTLTSWSWFRSPVRIERLARDSTAVMPYRLMRMLATRFKTICSSTMVWEHRCLGWRLITWDTPPPPTVPP